MARWCWHKTHALLQQNRQAAKENLRIQTLSFQEGFGTVAGVVDAQSALSQIDSETALNAYRYLLALATLLHSQGQLMTLMIICLWMMLINCD